MSPAVCPRCSLCLLPVFRTRQHCSCLHVPSAWATPKAGSALPAGLCSAASPRPPPASARVSPCSLAALPPSEWKLFLSTSPPSLPRASSLFCVPAGNDLLRLSGCSAHSSGAQPPGGRAQGRPACVHCSKWSPIGHSSFSDLEKSAWPDKIQIQETLKPTL